MEKYGVDMSELPVTDEQLRDIKKTASYYGVDHSKVPFPQNRVEADEILENIKKEGTKKV